MAGLGGTPERAANTDRRTRAAKRERESNNSAFRMKNSSRVSRPELTEQDQRLLPREYARE